MIIRLGGFTYLDKLTTLILANNWISTINDIAEFLPKLENIMLMNNKIANLYELARLGNCKKLKRLVLTNNPVTEKPNYRKYVIAHISSLTILDFKIISTKEKK
jgi:Leucine-rich repeat (LRR) protein